MTEVERAIEWLHQTLETRSPEGCVSIISFFYCKDWRVEYHRDQDKVEFRVRQVK